MSQSKAILITGCSSGIGLAAAQTLQSRGYQVIASCRKPEDVTKLSELGIKHVIQLDLASSESIRNAVKQTLSICDGGLYALFNNGAYGLPGAVEDLSREALARQFEVNLFGTHELTTLLLPTLLQQEDARIVQNSSVLGFVAAPNRGAYVASKFALEGLTNALRMELRGTAVQCIIIEPGPIQSQFRQNALTAFQKDIEFSASRHQAMYKQAMARLQAKPSQNMRFTLPPDAVVKVLIQALESKTPRLRYRVTVPTHLMYFLNRLLPGRWLDAFIKRFASP